MSTPPSSSGQSGVGRAGAAMMHKVEADQPSVGDSGLDSNFGIYFDLDVFLEFCNLLFSVFWSHCAYYFSRLAFSKNRYEFPLNLVFPQNESKLVKAIYFNYFKTAGAEHKLCM